jgi:hypothetical protein
MSPLRRRTQIYNIVIGFVYFIYFQAPFTTEQELQATALTGVVRLKCMKRYHSVS